MLLDSTFTTTAEERIHSIVDSDAQVDQDTRASESNQGKAQVGLEVARDGVIQEDRREVRAYDDEELVDDFHLVCSLRVVWADIDQVCEVHRGQHQQELALEERQVSQENEDERCEDPPNQKDDVVGSSPDVGQLELLCPHPVPDLVLLRSKIVEVPLDLHEAVDGQGKDNEGVHEGGGRDQDVVRRIEELADVIAGIADGIEGKQGTDGQLKSDLHGQLQ